MDLDAGQNPITRHLPKTGQVTQYFTYDDGYYEAGWWLRRLNNNNKIRFREKTISGDDVVIDRATGLMWPKDHQGAAADNGTMNSFIFAHLFCNALSFAGFSDWRLPNALELLSLAQFDAAGGAPYVWAPFTNTRSSGFWTNTTLPSTTTAAYVVDFTYPVLTFFVKSISKYMIAVRKGV